MHNQPHKFLYTLSLLMVMSTMACDIPSYSFHGFLAFDTAWDTRQVNAARAGHAILWPEPKRLDPRNRDINDKGQLSMIPFSVRGTFRVDGPQISENMYHYALCEADFRGSATELRSLLRLRLAYSDLDWGHTALRVGKAHHPMYPDDCTGNMVSYDNGEPPDTLIRVPQIRVTYRFAPSQEASSQELIAVFASQSIGALTIGPQDEPIQLDQTYQRQQQSSTDFIRRSAVPNVHFQYRHFSEMHLFGCGVDFVRTIPRLEANLVQHNQEVGFQDQQSLDSMNALAYLKFIFPRWTLRTKLLYTENATAYDLPNGFAVAQRNPDTDQRRYANLRAIGYWVDMDLMTDRSIMPGAFVGTHISLGSSEPLYRDPQGHLIIFSGQEDLDVLVKAAARLRYQNDPLEVGAEVHTSYATFATPGGPDQRKFDNRARPLQTDDAFNVRCIVNMYYYF